MPSATTSVPLSFAKYVLEKELWARLGLHYDEFMDRPAREVEQYLVYLQLINREEERLRAEQSGGSRHG